MNGQGRYAGLSRRDFLRMSALAGAGLIVGCRPGNGNDVDAADIEELAADFRGTLEFWDWDHEPRVELLEDIVSEWEGQREASLQYRPLEWTEIETRILTATAAGTGPAFSNMHFFWRYEAQKAGVLAPYPEDLFDFDALISTPFNRDPDTGNIYTCVFNYYCSQLYFNREMLDEEGIGEGELPRGWGEFIEMAQQLTRRNGDSLERAGFSLNDYWAREWLWQDLVYQAGGWLYNEDGTEALWNSDEGVEALKFIQDVYHTWNLDHPEFLEQSAAFGNGRAAFYTNQGYTAAGIEAEYPDMEDRWGTEVEPTLTGTPSPSWGMQVPEEGFVVFNRFSEAEQAAAFDFIEHALGSDERRIEWALLMDGPPDREDLLDHPDIVDNHVIRTQAETLPYRVAYGERPLEAERIWRNMFDEAILQRGDPRQIMDDATAEMNRHLADAPEPLIITERGFEPPS